MTTKGKHIVSLMLKGNYLIRWTSRSGKDCYRMFDDRFNPVLNVHDKSLKKINKAGLLKKDKHGRITLNLSKVRQLHGKNTIKKLYKQHLKQTA